MFEKTARDSFYFGTSGLRATSGFAPVPVAADDRINRAIAERLVRAERQRSTRQQQPEAAAPFAAGPVAAHVGEG